MVQNINPNGASVLIAEDDPDIRELIIAQFQHEPYAIMATGTAAGVREAMAGTEVDLLVLDLNLPDGDGVEICRQLRAEGCNTAIIMVTARDAAIDRVLGLELGADDYLTKPFEPRELLARVRNLLRRSRVSTETRPRNARFAGFGPWRLDLTQRRLVTRDGRLVMLSAAEFRLLGHFLDAPGRVLSREELSPERKATVGFDRTIDMQVSRLRQKLATELGGEEIILTIRSEGYLMTAPVSYE